MMKKIFLFRCLLLFFFPVWCHAQSNGTDSLRALIKNSKEDTQKVNLLLSLSKNYWLTIPESVMVFGNEALRLSEMLNYKKGLAFVY
jgi:hypothetical protein